MLHSSIQSSSPSSVNTVPPQHHLPQHPPHYRYAAAIIGGAVLITCCQNLDEGRQAGHLKPAKVILMVVLLVNSIVLLYALLDDWAEGVLRPGDHRIETGRIVLLGGALLSLLFLIALFYLDSLLLVGVFAMLVVLAAISTSVATVRLQYPPLWLEVILLSLMAVCSLLLMLNYAADKRERPREKELRGRRQSQRRGSSSSSLAAPAITV